VHPANQASVEAPPLPEVDLNLWQVHLGRHPMQKRSGELDLELNHPTVSREHATIFKRAGHYFLRDHDSANGSHVDGQRVQGEVELRPGALIRIGPYRFRLDGSILRIFTPQQMRLDGIDLVKQIFKSSARTTLLHPTSISVQSGDFIALLGCSGSGKTTLLNALCGYAPATGGQLLLNGEAVDRQLDLFRTSIGYVPQDDIVHTELTVEQVLAYAAELRLPQGMLPHERRRLIDDVLDKLHMTLHQHKLVSNLSGGQRKRVSVAVELLTKPSFLFLDEPTSGLDPGMEEEFMELLGRMRNRQSIGVVLVTHRLDYVAEQCNYVAMLSHGYLTFFGPMAEAIPFYSTALPTAKLQPISEVAAEKQYPKIYQALEASTPIESKAVAGEYHRSTYYERFLKHRVRNAAQRIAPQQNKTRPVSQAPFFSQWLTLTRRYASTMFNRHKRLTLAANLLLPIALGLLVLLASLSDRGGSIFTTRAENPAFPTKVVGDYTNAQILLLALTLLALFLGSFNAISEVVKEKAIYKRERMLFLQVGPYILSKLAVLSAFSVLQMLLLAAVVLPLASLPAQGVWLPTWLELTVTLMLTTIASVALGLAASAALKEQEQMPIVLVVLIIPQLLLSKALNPQLPNAISWLNNLTISRWGLEAMANSTNLNQIDDNPFFAKPLYHALDAADLGLNWLVLIAATVLLTVAAIIIQQRKDQR